MRTFVCLLTTLVPLFGVGQTDSTARIKKNVVKFVVTTNVFYANAFVLGYERAINSTQSLNIVGGRLEFPNVFSGRDIIEVDEERNKGGFTVGVDYRFYLPKENKHSAPRGVYIGPFVSYYQFKKFWTVSTSNSSANLDGQMIFLNIGGQIGYQFVVKDRFTFDFIFFGPSITNYRLNLSMQGDFTIDEENVIINEILDSFPLLDDLVEGDDVTVHGTNSTWAPGYRLTCMIGYTFGRKKK